MSVSQGTELSLVWNPALCRLANSRVPEEEKIGIAKPEGLLKVSENSRQETSSMGNLPKETEAVTKGKRIK